MLFILQTISYGPIFANPGMLQDILRSIARSYEWDADREDREVELRV
jgi:hypothetical protein